MTKDYKCSECGSKKETVELKLTLKFVVCPKHWDEMKKKTLGEILHPKKREGKEP